MKVIKPFKVSFWFLALISLIGSCKKDQHAGWNTDLLVPIITTNLSLTNIVKDSSLHTASDNSLSIVYQSALFNYNLADQIIRIPDTSIGQKFTLDSLQLPGQQFTYVASLGTMAQQQSGGIGGLIISQNHQHMVIPAISNLSPGVFRFDASGNLDSADVISGRVQIWAVNNLPITINGGVTINVNNAGEPTPVASYTTPLYDSIPPGDSIYLQIPLTGARIKSQLDFTITNLSSPGSRGQAVYIDTSNALILELFIAAIRVSQAWAKFPNQNIVDVTGDITQDIGNRKFTFVDARSGFLHIYITNSVPEKLNLEYELVGAFDKNGRGLKEFTTVPAAPPNSHITIDTLIDITGFSINLTGKDGSKFNTYTQRIKASIDNTGQTAHITLADSLNIRYELSNIAPNYIKGYIGQDTTSSIDSADFTFLNIFKSGTLDLQTVNMNLNVQNGIGVDGQVVLNSLSAYSPVNGLRTLTGPMLGKVLPVGRATDFPLTPSVSNFSLNSGNSNIKDLLGILPNKLYYNVKVKTNPNGNNRQYRDFAYLESGLKMSLTADLPLSLIANHLLLKDTIAFNLSTTTTTNVNGISDGTLNIIAENKYPIQANLTMVVYDSVWHPVDTLALNQAINAADLDNNCRAQQLKKTKIPEYVSEARMDKIKTGRHAIVTADFSTVSNNILCNGQHLKIYSDYTLGITLTAHFNYKISTGL